MVFITSCIMLNDENMLTFIVDMTSWTLPEAEEVMTGMFVCKCINSGWKFQYKK